MCGRDSSFHFTCVGMAIARSVIYFVGQCARIRGHSDPWDVYLLRLSGFTCIFFSRNASIYIIGRVNINESMRGIIGFIHCLLLLNLIRLLNKVDTDLFNL